MQIVVNPSSATLVDLLKRPTLEMAEIEKRVIPILAQVKHEGDAALYHFAKAFDKVELNNLAVSESEIEEAKSLISEDLKTAIALAYTNIHTFHSSQISKETPVETMAGITCWRKSVGIQKVGLYIPGGTAPLFSTVLMLGVPATIAGCEQLVLCTPPNKEGKIHPAILYAANLVGIKQIFKVGGAQAIAALAYGTETIPQVYKIFGPGNQYVTAAKSLVTKEGVAIDMPAGPSEVMVIADDSANAAFVASDLLSQAEHGVDSQVILLSKSVDLVNKVNVELEKQLAQLPRKDIAQKALENSRAIILSNDEEIMNASNQYSPEHLIIATENVHELIHKVINAGSVFIGNYTPESAGDYASGTNHTLPTNGYARSYSGVSLDSFVKKITFQEITKEGIKNIGSAIETMAHNEELFAHKNAVTLRLL